MAPTERILFVCLGNICRSPAAEGVVRAMAPHLELDSCGTGGWHVGEPPYGPMQAAASPFKGVEPESTATSDNPKTQIASSSGEPICKMMGRMMGMARASIMAP